MASDPAISIRGLRKAYDGVEAVAGIDLEVAPGEVFAFLGPNGAGKTTTVEILEGYRGRDAGEVLVLGEDPALAGRRWRERIGVVLQESRSTPELTVRETLELFAGYYATSRPVEEVLGVTGLGGKADARVGRLSGGQQRRLDVALALVGDPDLLFLDEPTTGFDPAARRQSWDVIAGLRGLGKTVFLTTHYMDEAQTLADRVAIIAAGRIVAEGPPAALAAGSARSQLSFMLPAEREGIDLPDLGGEVRREGRSVSVALADPLRDVSAWTGWASEQGLEIERLEVRRPTLEDIYLDLVDE